MIGTSAVSEFGGPISLSPSGPSQPSAPMIQIRERSSQQREQQIRERAQEDQDQRRDQQQRQSDSAGPSPPPWPSGTHPRPHTGDTLLTR